MESGTVENEQPFLIANSISSGGNLLSALKTQLKKCLSFDFCVAFVADGGLQALVESFEELKARGAHGRLLTSTYLNFNSPDAFRKLLEYDNIETRIYQGNLHAKGYIFDQGKTSTVIVGSSNMTQVALTCNKEWNVLYQTHGSDGFLAAVREEFDSLWNDELTERLSTEWISRYEEYRKQDKASAKLRKAAFVLEEGAGSDASGPTAPIRPNKMQGLALEALGAIHRKNDPRALLVSATGTGKTYLSAFDIQATRPRRVLFLAHRKRILSASVASYKRLLGPSYIYMQYQPGVTLPNNVCLFAMCSTIVRHLDEIPPDFFDYIVIDEAHRTGADSYQQIMAHFTPKFYLGMTATPSRTDGFDVFTQFNHLIAFQITLQDALANDMLAPFHYFGIADLEIDDEAVDSKLFEKLTSRERVRHITQKLEEYTVKKSERRGLIFCNRNEEARSLSDQFNELGYRTEAISGEDSEEARNSAIARLESGELEYLFSVDIMNEGVDIPSLNQIVMLRRTDSAIVFVQQLGRGLRKHNGKEYALVLDFIGNYQKNFFVPVALSGDKSFNKDRLRRIVQEGSEIVPGCSTVSFDRVSEARIYRAIDGGKFTSLTFLKDEYAKLKAMLGHIPTLAEFGETGSIDPLLLFSTSLGSYHTFLAKYEPSYTVKFDETQRNILKRLSQKLAAGKRLEDLLILHELIEHSVGALGLDELQRVARTQFARELKQDVVESAVRVLHGDFSPSAGSIALVERDGSTLQLCAEFKEALADGEFRRQVLEVIDFGICRNQYNYKHAYKETSLVLNAKYTYEDVCMLLNWKKNITPQNIGGYFYDEATNVFAVFINYDKAPDISATIQYEDRFLSERELIAISKSGRTTSSPEIRRLQNWLANGMKIYLFIRKNKNDEGSKEFYFLGEIYPTEKFVSVTTKAGKNAVEIYYRLDVPVRQDIYNFFLSDLG